MHSQDLFLKEMSERIEQGYHFYTTLQSQSHEGRSVGQIASAIKQAVSNAYLDKPFR